MLIGHIASLAFDADAIRVMKLAYDDVCLRLELPARDGPANRLVAAKIIEMAGLGERNPVELRHQVLEALGMACPV